MRRIMAFAVAVGLSATALATIELKDGVLTFDVASGTETYSSSIAEVTEIVKKGSGKGYLQLGAGVNSGFGGKVTIEKGTLGADDLTNWGSPSSIEVRDGGAFDLGSLSGHTKNAQNLCSTPVTIAGSGVNGCGALLLSTTGQGQTYEKVLADITLSADATISSPDRWTVRDKFDFGGHTLTHIGAGFFSFENVQNVPHAGCVLNRQGTFNIGDKTLLAGDGAVVLDGGTFNFWNQQADVKSPFLVRNTAMINAGYGVGTKNTIAAPIVHTNGTLTLNAQQAAASLTIKDTSFTTTDASFPDGSSSVSGPYLYLSGDGKILFDNVTVTNSLTKTKSECLDIRVSAFEWTAPGKTSVLSRLGVPSTNAWIHDAGRIDIVRGKQWYLEDANRAVKDPAKLVIEGTEVIAPFNASNYGAYQSFMLSNSSWNRSALLVVGEGAVVTSDLCVARQGQATVCQRGGELGWLSYNPLGINDLSSGCFYQSGGHCARLADHRIAACGDGFHRQTGGVFELVRGSGYIGFYGYAEVAILGGTYRSDRQHSILSPAWTEYADEYAKIRTHHPEAQFTVSGADALFENLDSGFNYISATSGACTVTLNFNDGGVFRVKRMARWDTSNPDGSKAYVNLNGGVLRFALANIYDVRNNDSILPDAITLYEKGVVLDTTGMAKEDMKGDGTDMRDFIYFNWPVKAATGKGVTAIALPTDAKFLAEKYAGPTHVKIVDPTGAGYGASAIMDWDPETCRVKGILVTGHGCNYGATTYATVDSAVGYTNAYPCVVTLADNATDGGITKRGPFDVHLNKANTFAGGVTVEEGRLVVANYSAIPNGNAITLKGGTFGSPWTNYRLTVPTVTGHGAISNVILTVTGGIRESAADLLAGRTIALEASTTLSLGADATFALTGYDALSADDKAAFDAAGRFTVMTFAKAFAGALPAATGLPDEWRLRLAKGGTELVAAKRVGCMVIVK